MKQKPEEGMFYTTREAYEWFKKEYARVYCHFVYVHTSPEGKKYVGHGKGKPNKRWSSGHGYRNNKRFQADIDRFGWDRFTHDIVLDELCIEEARKLERDTIIALESWKPEKGYNAYIPKEHTEEEHYSVYQLIFPNQKMYVGRTGVPLEVRWDSGYGYKDMPELMEDIKKYGWENVIKIRCMENILEESAIRLEQFLIRINRTIDPERGYNKSVGGETESGWHSSEESKAKAAEKLKGRRNRPEQIEHMKDAAAPRYKPVLNETTGEVYPSQAAAAEALGVDKTTISAALRGKLKTVKGCVLKRIEQEKQGKDELGVEKADTVR